MKKEIILILIFCFTTICFAQNDVEGGKDYHLLERMPNYSIIEYKDIEFEKHKFFIDNKYVTKEGRRITIKYRHKEFGHSGFEFPSRLQILRNYSNAINEAGGTIIFERYNSEYGHYTFKHSNKSIWLEVKPNGSYYSLVIIEEQPMRQDIIIDADLIKNKIEVEGKVAIYGIYFDTGKSFVKKESRPSLEQIAKYLKENPTINCWVVGHTDSDGSFEVNSKLSLERAKAVKEILEKEYDVASKRLFAEGVGPLAPVANNTTEEGKKLNRRVELVKQ